MNNVVNNISVVESNFIELGAGMALINVNEIACTRDSIIDKGFDIIMKNGIEFHCPDPEKYCNIKQLVTWL